MADATIAATSANETSSNDTEAATQQSIEATHNDDLPRRADRLTLPIVLVLVVGGLERAAFYAVSTPWREYIFD